MRKNMYVKHNNYLLSKKKTNWWCLGRKVPTHSLGSQLVLPKGIFFRVLNINPRHIATITGRFVSTRKPFARPQKQTRR